MILIYMDMDHVFWSLCSVRLWSACLKVLDRAIAVKSHGDARSQRLTP